MAVFFGLDEVAVRRRGCIVAACDPMGENNESLQAVRQELVLHKTEEL